MLKRFTIKNFKSIIDTTVDFTFAEKRAPAGYKDSYEWVFLPGVSAKQRLVPCLALYGPNASGKSNIVKAFAALQNFISGGQSLTFTYIPNKLHDDVTHSKFELEIINGKHDVIYTLEIDANNIISESLLIDSVPLYWSDSKHQDFSKLAKNSYSEERLHDIFTVECLKNNSYVVPVLSCFGKGYPGLNSTLTDVYSYILKDIVVCLDNNFPISLAMEFLSGSLYTTHEISENTLLETENLLKKLDNSVEKIEISREFITNRDMLNLPQFGSGEIVRHSDAVVSYDRFYTFHKKMNGKYAKFDLFTEESHGTLSLYRLIPLMLASVKNAKLLIVDELDRSLHPILVSELVRLFKSRRYNQAGKAQLIFTTHNTELLDEELLRTSEVGFITKTLTNGSELHRVCEYDDVRNMKQVRKLYRQGAFRGIPYPYI